MPRFHPTFSPPSRRDASPPKQPGRAGYALQLVLLAGLGGLLALSLTVLRAPHLPVLDANGNPVTAAVRP